MPVDKFVGDEVVEHAWLFGMAAKKREDAVLVGARGLNPAGTTCRIVVPERILAALIA